MNLPLSYRDFLAAKVVLAQPGGFEVADSDINPLLKPHQKKIVRWAIRGGRRAIFAAFGLGKTVIQLEIIRLVRNRIGGNALIVIPLGVRREFFHDAHVLMTGEDPSITDAQRADLAEWLFRHPEGYVVLHLCPLQFDIVDRIIEQFSMKGETVLDPFGGLMTVPLRALQKGRRGIGIELNPAYFADGVGYLEEAARERSTPTLFDLMGADSEENAA